MSSKPPSKKTVQTKTTTVSEETTTRRSSRQRSQGNGAETPQTASGSTSPRISRLNEKDELAVLNDRLAAFIDKVRQLEAENSRLEAKVRASDEATDSEIQTVKTVYERELTQTKRFLNETSRNEAQTKIENLSLKDENNKLKDQASKDKSEIKKLQDKIKQIETELQQETLMRVQLENKVTSMKEELAFKEQVHEEQIKECRSMRRADVSEVDSGVSVETLQASLQDLREQYEQEIDMINREFQSKYEEQNLTLRSQLDSSARAASKAIEEMKSLTKKVDEMSKTIRDLEAEKTRALDRARGAEREAEACKLGYMEEISRQNTEISRLRDEVARQVEECKELFDTKVTLDMEIATYRKLLEGEEERLNITPGSSPRRTPRKATRTLKRRINDTDFESFSSSSGLNVSSAAFSKGNISIASVDPEGKSVTLANSSDKEVSLGGWQIIRSAGSNSTVYKFHRAIKIAPEATVTVWSSDANQAHDPPSNLVMKGQKWVVSETMSTVVKNPSGEEEASYEYGKQSSTTTFKSRKVESFRGGPGTSLPGHGEGERCSVM